MGLINVFEESSSSIWFDPFSIIEGVLFVFKRKWSLDYLVSRVCIINNSKKHEMNRVEIFCIKIYLFFG